MTSIAQRKANLRQFVHVQIKEVIDTVDASLLRHMAMELLWQLTARMTLEELENYQLKSGSLETGEE